MRRWLARETAFRDKSLVGYWPLVENFLDYSGVGNHMTGSATPTPLSKLYGRVGLSTTTSNYAETTASSTLDLNALLNSADPARRQFTVSFWMFADSTINGAVLGQNEDAGGFGFKGWGFDVYPGFSSMSLRFQVAESSIYYVTSAFYISNVTVGRWVHVAATVKLQATYPYYWITLYIDGKPVNANYPYAGGGLTTAPTCGLRPITVGKSNATAPFGPSPSAAKISMVRAYARYLNEAEIGKIYKRELEAYGWKPMLMKPVSGNIASTLFTSGHDSKTNNRTLFISGEPNNGVRTLTILGHSVHASNTTLFTEGSLGFVNSGTLFLKAIEGAPNDSLKLFIEGYLNSLENGTSLSVFGANADGLVTASTLFVSGEKATVGQGMNLYTNGPDTISVPRNMNLYINGAYGSASNGFSLLVKGEVVNCPQLWEEWDGNWEDAENLWDCTPATWPPTAGAATLFLKGPSVGEYERGMNLYMRTPEGAGTTLFVQGPAGIETQGMTLYVGGAYGITQGMGLTVPNTDAAFLHGAKLYTHGF